MQNKNKSNAEQSLYKITEDLCGQIWINHMDDYAGK